ncbi:Uncharacterised protein [Mycolicibacterium phlei]|uniref:DUF6159 family protein n=1 Tax=Mycobacteroides chelonae TaxID=1774 RepID=UPI000618AA2B|nr:DUF6159 family protein [Mycobacteroides chelonae]VEG18289.1 Uncharacterised protein [Mycolicibacterium phlei]AKC39632.1 hypothetical protein GR01_15255 [Mycobacteroides chelonae]ANA99154.1 hypothetical protein BB28_16115 [Mycobacteroides chelonae CCUG 47445]OLT72849.1 hypothetical protein BKG56_23185 [Mycobacteroides chelonae]ORV12179.1 hypothetical protein AWB96_23115 [Mycobacteroides chelonae]
MAVTSTLSTSWQIFKTSAKVLSSRKELVFFPILSGLTALLVLIGMVTLGVLLLPATTGDSVPPLFYPVFAVGYFVLMYVATFWQAALISQANIALEGGDPSVAGGISAAAQRGGRLLPWVLITGVVSWIISAIEERVPFVGRLLDVAWRVVSFQVLPTIVLQNLGAIDAVKKTKETLKNAWGQNVVGVVGLNFFTAMLTLPGAGLIYLGVAANVTAVTGVLAALGALWILAGSIIGAALTGIFQTALYRFTVDGHVPGPFAGVDLRQALKTR